MVSDGQTITAKDVDAVTTGTFGVMSDTMAVMMVPVAEKCSFEKADTIWLNGVPAQPGPCPNERLGVVDLVVNGTSHADDRYGGRHLFRDLSRSGIRSSTSLVCQLKNSCSISLEMITSEACCVNGHFSKIIEILGSWEL